MHELLERDAYTKEMWLTLLPHGGETTLPKTLADRYRKLRARFDETRINKGLQAALIESAAARDSTLLNTTSPDGHLTNLIDDCHDTALGNTQRFLSAAKTHNLTTIICRSEDDDLYLIGESLGPNSLGIGTLDKKYKQPHALSEKHRAWLDDLNTQMGIHDKNDLPTFKEALAAQGLTPESYKEQLHVEIPAAVRMAACRQPYAQHM